MEKKVIVVTEFRETSVEGVLDRIKNLVIEKRRAKRMSDETPIEGIRKYQYALGGNYREQIVDADGNHRTVVKADTGPVVVYQDLNKSQVLALEYFFATDSVAQDAWAQYVAVIVPRLIELGIVYADFKGELPNLDQTRRLVAASNIPRA